LFIFLSVQKRSGALPASYTGGPPSPRFTADRKKKIWKIKEVKVHKFQNARQARTGRNMVKSNSPLLDASSFVPILTLPRRTCHHSASSVLTVRISCRVIAVFVFRKQQEKWRSRWIPTIR